MYFLFFQNERISIQRSKSLLLIRYQDDWEGYVHFTERVGKETQVVGDDLLVTNPTRIQENFSLLNIMGGQEKTTFRLWPISFDSFGFLFIDIKSWAGSVNVFAAIAIRIYQKELNTILVVLKVQFAWKMVFIIFHGKMRSPWSFLMKFSYVFLVDQLH